MQRFWPFKSRKAELIIIELDEMAAEKMGMAAVIRSAPTHNSRDWNHKSALRLQEALSAAQAAQTPDQIKSGILPLALTEAEWKAVARLCAMIGEKGSERWARRIVTRVMSDAMQRGAF